MVGIRWVFIRCVILGSLCFIWLEYEVCIKYVFLISCVSIDNFYFMRFVVNYVIVLIILNYVVMVIIVIRWIDEGVSVVICGSIVLVEVIVVVVLYIRGIYILFIVLVFIFNILFLIFGLVVIYFCNNIRWIIDSVGVVINYVIVLIV